MNRPILLKIEIFTFFSCRYHLQLHWSCWRALPAHHGSWMHATESQYCFYMGTYVYSLFCLKNNKFIIFCRYHLQLHWRCWRAVPGHLWWWLHWTCQYHCCMWTYKNGLFYFEQRGFLLFQLHIPSADTLKLLTSSSSTPLVMSALNMMSIPLLYVYI